MTAPRDTQPDVDRIFPVKRIVTQDGTTILTDPRTGISASGRNTEQAEAEMRRQEGK